MIFNKLLYNCKKYYYFNTTILTNLYYIYILVHTSYNKLGNNMSNNGYIHNLA